MAVAEELWGAETRKAVENFPVSGERVPVPVIRWLGRIKAAARTCQRRAGPARSPTSPTASPRPATRSRAGEHDDQFPIDVFQTGSGTSSNMNANEVIANLAGERRAPERPREHGPVLERRVPLGRAPGRAGRGRGRPAARARASWSGARRRKAEEFADVVKTGRTHLMDAVPVTLGQEFGGYAAQIRLGRAADRGRAAARGADPARRHRDRHRAEHAPRVRGAGARAARARHGPRDPPARATPSRRRATATRWSSCRACSRCVAVSLTKIANDIAWMGSGPRAGLAELFLPELQKGSSIMPGKVNPVIREVVLQVGRR